MIVSRDEKWEIGFSRLKEYYGSHGHCNVPHKYISPDGYRLGQWVHTQRIAFKRGKLCHNRYELLSKFDFRFSSNDKKTMWLNGYSHLTDYCNNHGDANVPVSYVSPDGYCLGQWVHTQRIAFKRGKLCHEMYELLSKLNFKYNVNDKKTMWLNGYNHLIDYCSNHGVVHVPQSYISPDGFKLGYWVYYNQINYKLLSITQIKKLEATGFFPLWHETHTW